LESAAPDSDLPDEEAPQSRYRYRLLRELLILAVAALVGFLLMPFLIWTVGHSALGPYNHGGPGGLLADFMSGLAHGSLIYWAVLRLRQSVEPQISRRCGLVRTS
jgi:hypothetical protein